jgi:uncharacterized membrane protein
VRTFTYQGRLAWASLTMLLVGLVVTIYLTVVHYRTGALVCAVGGDCHKVQSSKYATVGPIPVAILGLALMVVLIGLWIARARGDLDAFTATGMSFVLLFSAMVCEGYLTYVEIYVLDAICAWCVTFAVLLVILVVLETIQLVRLTET